MALALWCSSMHVSFLHVSRDNEPQLPFHLSIMLTPAHLAVSMGHGRHCCTCVHFSSSPITIISVTRTCECTTNNHPVSILM